MKRKVLFLGLISAFLLAGCSQVASGDDLSDDDNVSISASDFIDGGWTFKEWNYVPYYFPEMFESVAYEPIEVDSMDFRFGKYLDLNSIIPSTDSVYFYFQNTGSKRYIFGMDNDGGSAPILRVFVYEGNVVCDVEAIEKDGRWYYPIDMDNIYAENKWIDVGLYDGDGEIYSRKVNNGSVFDSDTVYSLEFSANLIVAGKYMGANDRVSVDEIAKRMLDRLNMALNPGGVIARQVNVLYAKDHPVAGAYFSEDKSFVLGTGEPEADDMMNKLARWPGHEGEINFVLGYYVDDEDGFVLGESSCGGKIYNDESQSWVSYISLGTHWNWGGRARSSQKIAETALHELGHFFGLSHTSEFGGKNFDNLDDTPECPFIGNSSSNNDRCPDSRYLMFPQASDVPYITFTPEQMDVIRTYLSTTLHK